jgi:hypothetical protein
LHEALLRFAGAQLVGPLLAKACYSIAVRAAHAIIVIMFDL